jgi:hypothetical protein
MPKRDGTPCKHTCQDKAGCSHSCCKDRPEPPPNGVMRPEFNDSTLDAKTDEASDGDDAENGNNQFAKILGKSLAEGLALKKRSRDKYMMIKQRLKIHQPLDRGDVDDFDKVTDHLRKVESLATGNDYAVPINQLAGSFPDEDVRNICVAAVNEQEGDGAMAISYLEWQASCMEIYTKLFGSPTKIMAKVNNGFSGTAFKARAENESLEAYHRRFKLKLYTAMWVRAIYSKPNDSEWMTEKLEKWIMNLNSNWAGIHVMAMAATSSLQEIFDKLQYMTHIKDLNSRD